MRCYTAVTAFPTSRNFHRCIIHRPSRINKRRRLASLAPRVPDYYDSQKEVGQSSMLFNGKKVIVVPS